MYSNYELEFEKDKLKISQHPEEKSKTLLVKSD